MKALRSILAGILVGASAILPTQTQAVELPKPYVQTSFVSAYVAPAGPFLKENARQDWLSINPIKNLELGIWQNQFLGEKGIAERDYCASYSAPISSNLTASLGVQYWHYPNERFGNHDSAIDFDLKHKGSVDTSLKFRHINHTSQTEAGNTLCASVSKTIPLTEGKLKLSLTPSLSTAVNQNYYGGNNGLGHVTPGIKLGCSYGNFNASIFFNAQEGLSEKIGDLDWGGFSAGYSF